MFLNFSFLWTSAHQFSDYHLHYFKPGKQTNTAGKKLQMKKGCCSCEEGKLNHKIIFAGKWVLFNLSKHYSSLQNLVLISQKLFFKFKFQVFTHFSLSELFFQFQNRTWNVFGIFQVLTFFFFKKTAVSLVVHLSISLPFPLITVLLTIHLCCCFITYTTVSHPVVLRKRLSYEVLLFARSAIELDLW